MSDRPSGTRDRRLDRRELIRTWGPAAVAGVAFTALGAGLHDRPGRHRPPTDDAVPTPRDWRTAAVGSGRLAESGGAGPVDNLRRALAAMGGMAAFVRPGETVAVKPNCAWDRTPEQAANTNPDLVAELVRQAVAAGASSVVVVDNSCHDPDRAFERSGIGPAARAAGARIAHQHSARTVTLDLEGTVLGRWEVLEPIASADRLINVPIVKHHSLARATLGMKNWIGAVEGPRSSLHQRLPQVCAELAAAIRPTLTVVDATRVLTAGGPTGGSLDLVRPVDRIAVSTDPVAAEVWGAELLDLGPRELPQIAIAERLGLGTADWKAVAVST